MTITELINTVPTPYFTTLQLQKMFPEEIPTHINVQLMRMVQKKTLVRLKRGVFIFPNILTDEFLLANILYPQSYVSLESALNTYGIIPDVPAQITSVTPLTSKKIVTTSGVFLYSKIDSQLYFGFQQVSTPVSSPSSSRLFNLSHRLAEPEKALLDYIYIRRVKNLMENRIDIKSLNKERLREYVLLFPDWVKRVLYE